MWKLNLSVFIFLCLVYEINSYSNQGFKDVNKISTPKGLAEHILNPLAINERKLITPKCWQHLKHYAKSLITFRLWALLMFDASAKFPTGLLRGYGAGLGSFDECLKIKKVTENLGTIRGKYCLGGITLLQMEKSYYGIEANTEKISDNSTNSIELRFIDFAKGKVDLAWGVCLPDSCSAKDFEVLHKLFFLHFSEDSCQTIDSEVTDFDAGDIAAISILGVITGIIISSTIYDITYYYKRKEHGNFILCSFSIWTNASKINTIRSNKNEISCIYGLRTLSLLMLMYGYRYVAYVFAPLINWLDMFRFMMDKNTASVIDAIVCGDTFFVISGFLVSYNYHQAKKRGIKFNVLIFYLNRLIRLTPALCMAVLIHATLMRHIGSGPVWPNIRDTWLVNSCRESWWANLFYVQNYLNPDITKICMLQTWHLAVDMQLFILSPLVLIPLSRWPRYTLSVVASLLFASILSPFLTAWVYKLKAVIATNRSLEDVNDYMKHFFFPTHTRASSWIIGFLLGYFIYVTTEPEMKAKVKQKLNKFFILLLWAAAMGLLILSIMIGREMIGEKYNWVTHAFHMALIRPAWSTGVALIIFACVHGYGGPINSFLSAPIFEVLSRISYGTYLVNFSVLFLITYQTRSGLEFGNFDAFYRFLGDIGPSLALGFVWTLAFESPLITIGKVIFCQPERIENIQSTHANKI